MFVTMSDLRSVRIRTGDRRRSVYRGASGLGQTSAYATFQQQLPGLQQQWQTAVANNDGTTLSSVLNQTSALAQSAMNDPSVPKGATTALTVIVSNSIDVVAALPIANNDVPTALASTTLGGMTGLSIQSAYDGLNAAANQLNTQQNVIAAASSGANVQNSAIVAASFAQQQQTLIGQIAQFQPGGTWDPSQAIALSGSTYVIVSLALGPLATAIATSRPLDASTVQGFQGQWQQLDSSIQAANNANQLTASDYANLYATQQQILGVLWGKSVQATTAGSSVDAVITKAGGVYNAITGGQPQSGSDLLAKQNAQDQLNALKNQLNALNNCLTSPLTCTLPLPRAALGSAVGAAVGGLAGLALSESTTGAVIGLFGGLVLGGALGYISAPAAPST